MYSLLGHTFWGDHRSPMFFICVLYVSAVSVNLGMYLKDIAVDDWLVLTRKYIRCDLYMTIWEIL